MKFREVEKILLKDGWYQVKQKGSNQEAKYEDDLPRSFLSLF